MSATREKQKGKLEDNVPAVPLTEFGRDHWSTLLYFETRCVDSNGLPKYDNLRVNPLRHPAYGGAYRHREWDSRHSTRLKGWTAENPLVALDHDDVDCVFDLEREGLLEVITGAATLGVRLTNWGWSVVGVLRRCLAESSLSGKRSLEGFVIPPRID